MLTFIPAASFLHFSQLEHCTHCEPPDVDATTSHDKEEEEEEEEEDDDDDDDDALVLVSKFGDPGFLEHQF